MAGTRDVAEPADGRATRQAAERRPLPGGQGPVQAVPAATGLLRRVTGSVNAVDGVELSIAAGHHPRAGRRERIGQVDPGPPGHSASSNPPRGAWCSTAPTSRPCAGRKLRRERQRMQMVFQDPYSSLDPRQSILEVVGEPLRDPHRSEPRPSATAGDRTAGPGRDRPPRARPPAPRVLRWPAPAHRHRPGAGARSRPARVRRAGLRPRRLDAVPGDQPLERPAGPAGPGVPVHRPRPVGGPSPERPHRGRCTSGRSSRRGTPTRSTSARPTPTRRRCCRRSRCRIRTASAPGPTSS